MAQPTPDVLQRIETLLIGGRLQESRLLLLEYIKSNPSSAKAWWLLSQAVVDPDQQMDCLERVLRIDPTHTEARERMATLKAMASQPPASTPALFMDEPEEMEPDRYVFPEKEEPAFPSGDSSTGLTYQNAAFYPGEEEREPEPAPIPVTKRPRKASRLLDAFLILFLLAAVGVVGWYFWQQRQVQAAAEDNLHTQQTQSVALMLTELPTFTLTGTPAASPSLTATPLDAFTPTVDHHFTPTPPATGQYRPEAGFYAPDFSLKDAKTGSMRSLKQALGIPILLHFCNATSPACREEVDSLKAISQKYSSEELMVLSILSGESITAIDSFQKAHQIPYPLLVDLDDAARKLYQVDSLPAFYFIDANGQITSIAVGLQTYPQLIKQLGSILP